MSPTTPEVIDQFDGEYRFLSNFAKTRFEWPGRDGVTYTVETAEHAFQAEKVWSVRSDAGWDYDRQRAEYRRILTAPSARDAKRRGRALPLDPDAWDRHKDEVMARVLVAKFVSNDHLARRLMDTDPVALIEGNTWHDDYWGDCRCGGPDCQGRGRNRLGDLLGGLRAILIAERRAAEAGE